MWFWRRPRFFSYQVEGRQLVLRLAYFRGEVWFTQKQIAQVLGLKVPTVNEHLKKIFTRCSQPDRVQEFTIKAADGKSYQVKHYRFDIVEEIQDRLKPLS